MGPTFDAQRNEFSAYVLREEQTPFGLTLGNFKTFATSTPKGGIDIKGAVVLGEQ